MQNDKKVLIIDDEIDLSILLKSYFVRKGFEVYLAHDIKTGLALVEEVRPAILFIDNNLPDGHGWEVVPALALKHPTLRFFLLSAFHPTIPHLGTGIDFTIIEKPVSFSDLDKKNWGELVH